MCHDRMVKHSKFLHVSSLASLAFVSQGDGLVIAFSYIVHGTYIGEESRMRKRLPQNWNHPSYESKLFCRPTNEYTGFGNANT